MPSQTPSENKDRRSDPSTSPLTPSPKKNQRGPGGSRGNSGSPRKHQAKQPLHIRMNLTETQMDRITDAFTNKVSSSPVRARPRVEPTPTKSTAQAHACGPRRQVTYSLSSSGDDESQMASTTFSELMPGPQGDLFSASLAERRQHQAPAPIRVGDGRTPGRAPHRRPRESVSHAVSPLSPTGRGRHERGGGEEAAPYYPSGQSDWLYRRNANSESSEVSANGPVMDTYDAWAQTGSPVERVERPPRGQSLAQRPRRSKSTSEGLGSDILRRPDGWFSPSPPPPVPRDAAVMQNLENLESPLFSPLALYFRGNGFPTEKKGEKTMIGRNGWLERTGRVSPDKAKKAGPKKAGILESIKKIAKDMTAEFHYANRRSQPSARESGASHVAISLDAREQSLLYCELEFHLTTALNDYMTGELDKGHLVADNLKKICDWWASQGRPKVVGFRYDLETQLELVNLHVHDFNFYGRRQSSAVEIAGLVGAMKTNARQMRVRTFCQPDSVIAKQLVDAQSLFNMINVSNAQQIALAEIAQFFKVIVERERGRGQGRVREVRKTPVSQPGEGMVMVDVEWQRLQGGRGAHEARAHGYQVEQDPLPYAR